MTSGGSAYARFKRALETQNVAIIRAAAAELPQVRLDDALRICVIMANREPHRYEAAAVRWLARFCVEQEHATLEEIAQASAALRALRTGPTGPPLRVLRGLCAPRALAR